MASERSVLVTGGSSGIGRACALRLDAAGWRVFATVRRTADADELRREASARLEPLLLDVTDDGQAAAAADAVGERLDGLVNNAGVALAAPLELVPLEAFRYQLEVNLMGQLRVTQALLPKLRRAWGRIVFVSSISGRSAVPFLGPYSASKFALEALADALRLELLPLGVDVTLVEPGSIATPIWRKGAETADELGRSWPPEIASLYEPSVAVFRAAAAEAERRGDPPEVVARAIERALGARRPRTRYLVGKDARPRVLLERLPDRLRDRLLARVLLAPRPWPSGTDRRRLESHRGAERGGAR